MIHLTIELTLLFFSIALIFKTIRANKQCKEWKELHKFAEMRYEIEKGNANYRAKKYSELKEDYKQLLTLSKQQIQ